MAQIVVVDREAERAAGMRAHVDTVPGDPLHRRPIAVDQPPPAEVPRPHDLVPGSQRQRPRFAEREIARRVARGRERAALPPALQPHPVLPGPGHGPGLALAQAVHVPVGDHDIARPVALPIGGMDPGQSPVHQAADLHAPAPQHAFVRKTPAHRRVDLFPHLVGRRQDDRSLPRVRRQRQPQPRRRPGQRFRRQLPHVGRDALHRQRRIARNHVLHRRLQVHRALPDHVVHPRRRHARALQQAERLPRIHRAQLKAVPHQNQARHPERRQDPLKVAHLHRPHHRGLVDHHHRVLGRSRGPAQSPPPRPSPRRSTRSASAAIAGWSPRYRPRRRAPAPPPTTARGRTPAVPRPASPPRSASGSCRCPRTPAPRPRGRASAGSGAPPPSAPPSAPSQRGVRRPPLREREAGPCPCPPACPGPPPSRP